MKDWNLTIWCFCVNFGFFSDPKNPLRLYTFAYQILKVLYMVNQKIVLHFLFLIRNCPRLGTSCEVSHVLDKFSKIKRNMMCVKKRLGLNISFTVSVNAHCGPVWWTYSLGQKYFFQPSTYQFKKALFGPSCSQPILLVTSLINIGIKALPRLLAFKG